MKTLSTIRRAQPSESIVRRFWLKAPEAGHARPCCAARLCDPGRTSTGGARL